MDIGAEPVTGCRVQQVDLSVILPAYQEEENLRILLPRLHGVLVALGLRYEILVVDTLEELDLTAQVCEQQKVKYVRREGGNYYGDAIRTGIQAANGKFILFMDADGSHTPEFIPRLYGFVNEYDIIVASRYIDKGHTENGFVLTLLSRILNITYSIVLNIPCKDVSNSFKIYRADHVKKLKLDCDNFDIVEEVIYKISKKYKNIKIKEVPYIFKKRMFGETKRNLIIFVLTYIYTIIRLRIKA